MSPTRSSLLTCISISTSGKWLAAAFVDSSLLFLDFRTGRTMGSISFDSRFNVLSAAWRSDKILLVGCSNGLLFHVDFDIDVSEYSYTPG